jgi:hypothetical protein
MGMAAILYLSEQKGCCHFFKNLSTLERGSSENVYKNLPSDCEFHENWHSDSHALLRGANKFLLMLLTSTVQFQ